MDCEGGSGRGTDRGARSRWFGRALWGMAAFAMFGLPAWATDPLPDDPTDPSNLVALGPEHVLILVNANSPAGMDILREYRARYPEITDDQVVYLTGLVDSASAWATPNDEILFRSDFENLIARPVRQALLTRPGLLDQVYCIITTAGMPYRIEDTSPELAGVVKPAGSSAPQVVQNLATVNAASVESELSVLFLIEQAPGYTAALPIQSRLVNPYQGYAVGIRTWMLARNMLARRDTFRWTYMWRVSSSPLIEGEFSFGGYSAAARRMSPADIFLVARLDGPRNQGQTPTKSVELMLERSAVVSDPDIRDFRGYNGGATFVAIDNSPVPPAPDVYADTAIYNFPPQYEFLWHDLLADLSEGVPPGAEEFNNSFNGGDHYRRAFECLVDEAPPAGTISTHKITMGLGGNVVWDDTGTILNDRWAPPGKGLFALLTYGRNAGDGRPADYLLRSGNTGGFLFQCAYGAVFSSLESFNAVTMFTSAATTQGKIVDFIEIGGTAAVGHSFEPEVGATIQGEYLLANLLRDDDGDGIGDLTLVEAVYTALPYLSWSEVLIGDPLMRLHAGPGGLVGGRGGTRNDPGPGPDTFPENPNSLGSRDRP
ncbi:MAG: hypothetical protein GY778_13025 [bacterium]|nr:hypothetical protein [bacterium]